MSTKKRDRENARRRYADWQARQNAKAARVRRLRQVVSIVLGLIAAAVVIALVVIAARPDAVETAADSTASEQPPSPTTDPDNPCDPSTAKVRDVSPTGGKAPDKALADNRTWTATLQTSCGDITLTLDGAKAPQSVANFVTLARDGYFADTPCHRLTMSGIYVLQCGDPSGTGTGGPGYAWGPVENAPSDDSYPAGTLAMARQSGNGDSQGSQFFIVYKDSTIPSDAAGGYSVFGKVDSGLDVVTTVADGGTQPGGEEPARAISIKEVTVQ